MPQGPQTRPLLVEHGPRRFSELRVPLREVTQKVLTKSLRCLERDGLVARVQCPSGHVDYSLTPLGRSLLQPMAVACEWSRRHWDELLDAREAGGGREHGTGFVGAPA